MEEQLIEEGKYRYIEVGQGTPVIILHGLMGGLSNFQGVTSHFPDLGYPVLVPELPIYDMPMLKTTVKNFAKFLDISFPIERLPFFSSEGVGPC